MTIQLIHADCLDVDWPQVDAIITDVPYGTTACKWDVIIPFDKMWAKIKGALKPRGAFVTTASQPFTSALVMSNPKWFKCEWIWEKTMPNNFCQAKYNPMRYHENVLIFSNSKTTYNPIMEERSEIGKERLKNSGKVLDGSNNTSNFMSFKRGQGIYREYDKTKVFPKSVQKIGSVPNCNGTKLHPTQKPVALYEYLIKTYTNEGDTVLDFCMGSGTTGMACNNTGRNFIGIEKDDKYFEIAEARIQ